MEELKLVLENCYGINKLEYTLKFYILDRQRRKLEKHAVAIYSPNGIMKTSFAKTFKDVSKNQETKDLIFPERETKREIKDEGNNNLIPDQVFVVEPYDEKFDSKKKSTLLANSELKNRYEDIHKEIDKSKDNLLKKLKQKTGLSGRNNNIEIELEKSFGEKFFDIILTLEEEITSRTNSEFSNIIYKEIYNVDVLNFLSTKDFKHQISQYIEKYEDLIAQSDFFKKDFNHYNASTIQKNLGDNGFFKASHSLNMNNGSSKVEVFNEEELNDLINAEKEKVLQNPDVKKQFNEIDKKLTKASLRKFRDYLFDNQEILIKLENLDQFRKELWIAYFVEQKELFIDLLKTYKSGKTEIDTIIESAKEEFTDWEKAVKKFNKRFTIPFSLIIKNKDDVILNGEVATVDFHFKDNNGEKDVDRKTLLEVLSQGERRALYILNIIFEIEARTAQNEKNLFIIDDIADSFDYKNKYAIIEYLKEMSENDSIYLVILTHNFDFFRTIASRFVNRKQCFMVTKSNSEIKLIQAEYLNNPFRYLKENINDKEKFITAIPFVRNLSEYTKDKSCNEYLKLTSLLHQKSDTSAIRVIDLENLYKSMLPSLSSSIDFPEKDKLVTELIFELADIISQDRTQSINLEHKMILSMAIRHKAEIYMINEINEQDFVNSLSHNQTIKLIKRFKHKFETNKADIEVLEEVNLMTPENIHFNTFMFEPILDISDVHLKKLYNDVKALGE